MAQDRFLIAPYNSGLVKNNDPWMIPDDAFEEIHNAYVWRNRVKKRPGATVMDPSLAPNLQQTGTRLRIAIPGHEILANTDAGGNAAGFAPATGYGYHIGQVFTIGAIRYTVIAAAGAMDRFPAGAGIYTFDTATGAYNFLGQTPLTPIHFYPGGYYQTDANGYIQGRVPGAIIELGQMLSVGDCYLTVRSNALGFLPLLATNNAGTLLPLGNVTGAGTFDAIIPGPFARGQVFFIDDGITSPIFIVNSVAAGPQPLIRNPSGGGVQTFNVTTGTVNITGETPAAPVYWLPNGYASFNFATQEFNCCLPNYYNTALYFYPSTPVMHFGLYERGIINDNTTIAFDQQFAYRYGVDHWTRLGTAEWTGSNLDYFWSCSWRALTDDSNVFFVVNNVVNDHIRYWDDPTWTILRPIIYQQATTSYLETAKIIVTFKDRLIALNTTESDSGAPGIYQTYVNRARCCQIGDPTNANLSWRTDIQGRGYYVDAPTKQPITTCTIIHDRLLVYFESSTWELVYTSSDVYPFVWQQLNSELGAQSTHSVINFDNQVFAIGTTGIHTCNGNNVTRIDNQIPDETFRFFATLDGTKRVAGIREFYEGMIYWAVPYNPEIQFENISYPNKILAYNYVNNSYSYFDDCITTFGYYERQDGLTWERVTTEWQYTHFTWNSGEVQSHPKQIIAGNHQGWTFIVQPNISKNSMSMSISNFDPATLIMTCYHHNLPHQSYIYIENCIGIIEYNDHIVQAIVINENTFSINSAIVPGAGPYLGGGTITRVSQLSFFTKEFNFYIKENRNAAINKIDFLVSNFPNGSVAVEYYPSYSRYQLQDEAVANQCALGTNILELTPYDTVTLESFQEKFWHCLYFMGEGQSVQFELFYNESQMTNIDAAFAGFELHAMTIYANPTSYTTR